MKVSKDEDITTFTGKFILKATMNQQSPPVKTKAKKKCLKSLDSLQIKLM